MAITVTDIREAIREAGLADRVIALHSSLKSFGNVEGGAAAVIRAFLDCGCTLVVPAFTYYCAAEPPMEAPSLRQNAYTPPKAGSTPRAFSPEDNQIVPEMGAIPRAVLNHPDRKRGYHPLNSFAAVGPGAEALTAGQSPDRVYAPYEALYQDPNACIVLAGVDLTKATPIHYAEQRSGRRLFIRWGLGENGVVHECLVGSCSNGFSHLDPLVREIEERRQVGESLWRIYPFRLFIDILARAIQEEPGITHCPDPDCLRCRDTIAGGPFQVQKE